MLQWETGAVSVLLFLGSMNGTDERCRKLMTRAYAAALALQDLVGGKVESLFVLQSERRKGNFLVPKKEERDGNFHHLQCTTNNFRVPRSQNHQTQANKQTIAVGLKRRVRVLLCHFRRSAAVLHFCRFFLFSRNASFLLSLFLGLPRHQASLGNRSECVVPDEYLHLSFPLLYGAVFARKERERKEKAISSFIV